MKRRDGELRYDYCARRIMEQQIVKEKLKGTLVWCSSMLVPSPSDKYKDLLESERPLVKVQAQGTYRKPIKEVT
jgi:hypothetical protein